MTFYEVCWIFAIYSFVGWCTEVCYVGLKEGHFVNRGFLNGGYCPIYGFGVLLVLEFLEPLKTNFVLLYAGSVLFTTTVEFITGFLLEKCFGSRWWDYTDEPFNIKGYVCLRFSLLWGIGCLIVVDIFHPVISKGYMFLPQTAGIVILAIYYIALLADVGYTVTQALHFKKELRLLAEIAEKLHALSDDVGENVYGAAVVIRKKNEETRQEMAEERLAGQNRVRRLREEYECRSEEIKKELENKIQLRRHIRAFPKIRPVDEKWRETFAQLKQNIEQSDRNRKKEKKA